MTQTPTDPQAPSTAPPVDRDALLAILDTIVARAARRQHLVRVGRANAAQALLHTSDDLRDLRAALREDHELPLTSATVLLPDHLLD